ncbi:sigma-70 family RNA polymerase sigma factor [Pseudoflavitalea sp. X16]|uniref:RNA polymerase sigma factor n=1 Tax=Paraflavitalea devenefica TaxID=2716334 RepID=UPI001424942C|nr:sigma-70 family RNA polymerase sigma factor [Paraflavitalea devenefica]NII26113.1 sigma-70 family RNA polymerase sigma factor [Paraflavitalea devenefica]
MEQYIKTPGQKENKQTSLLKVYLKSNTMKPVLNDMDLLSGLILNHTPAFSQFYTETKFPFIYFTHEKLGDWHESEIIVDNVFVKLWEMSSAEKKEKFDHLFALKKYMYTACTNAVNDRFRVKQKLIPVGDVEEKFGNISVPSTGELREAQIIEVELLKKLHREIAQLTPDRRKIFHLHMEGLNTAQIAAEMGMSEVAVRNAKFKGLQVLRKKLLPGELALLLSILNSADKVRVHQTVPGLVTESSPAKSLDEDARRSRIVGESVPRMRL